MWKRPRGWVDLHVGSLLLFARQVVKDRECHRGNRCICRKPRGWRNSECSRCDVANNKQAAGMPHSRLRVHLKIPMRLSKEFGTIVLQLS